MYEEVQSKLPSPPEFLQTTFIHLLGFLGMKVGWTFWIEESDNAL